VTDRAPLWIFRRFVHSAHAITFSSPDFISGMPPCSSNDRSAACWSELSPTEEFGECQGLESGGESPAAQICTDGYFKCSTSSVERLMDLLTALDEGVKIVIL
jgi:hypothetical protein